MSVKKTWRNRIQTILSSKKGIYSDCYWTEVHNIFSQLNDIGCSVVINSAEYMDDASAKIWLYDIEVEGYKFSGVLNAHAAGSVQDPFDRYDISAYLF